MPTAASPAAARSTPGDPSPQRLIALDAFRGITITGMLIVNNPGSWSHIYSPLRHAQWNGWTPTDLVFPFFLFIVGVALSYSLRRRETGGHAAVFAQLVRRAILIFLLGLFMASFPDLRLLNAVRAGTTQATWLEVAASLLRLPGPYILGVAGVALLLSGIGQPPRAGDRALVRRIVGGVLTAGAVAFFIGDFHYFQESALRVPGVLQRIAICYFCGALLFMTLNVRWQIVAVVVLLLGYWAIVARVPAPANYTSQAVSPDGRLHDWIDTRVLHQHLYAERPDPEGLLSTLPAIATVLAGALTGRWLQGPRDVQAKVVGLFVAANILLVAGLGWGLSFPINKKIWTSSYVLLTAGLALHFLAMCLWLIDLRGRRAWAWPFVVLGSNAITIYVAASTCAKCLAVIRLADNKTTLKGWLYEHVCASLAGPLNGSLLYALVYVSLWLIPAIVLYRRRIFIKV